MKTKVARVILSIMFILACLPAMGQNSRSYIRGKINDWGECRNVAITRTNGDIALYGTNGWAGSGLPSGLMSAIRELHNNEEYIDDIQLTERGSWLILYGNNGLRWSGIPYSLEREIRHYNSQGEVITSVTFNDSGDWIVITTEHISSSHSNIQDWLVAGMNNFGKLWTACVTDDGMVAVYENGYKFYGNVPSDLRSNLNSTSLDVYRLKIAGTSWFFADKDGSYQYNM